MLYMFKEIKEARMVEGSKQGRAKDNSVEVTKCYIDGTFNFSLSDIGNYYTPTFSNRIFFYALPNSPKQQNPSRHLVGFIRECGPPPTLSYFTSHMSVLKERSNFLEEKNGDAKRGE